MNPQIHAMTSVAREVIRRALRKANLEVMTEDFSVRRSGQLQALEDAQLRHLLDRDHAWALAYLAGVRMSPFVKALDGDALAGAQARPATPSQQGGAA